MRRVSAAVVALAAQPGGFTTEELTSKTRLLWADRPGPYAARHAAYDLAKLRDKSLVERIDKTRRYRVHPRRHARESGHPCPCTCPPIPAWIPACAGLWRIV